MRINSLQSYKPAFKAQFSDDEETKSILKGIVKVSPYVPHSYMAVNLLKEIDNDDSISISQKYSASTRESICYVVKNDNTGAKIEVFSNIYKPLIKQLNQIFYHTSDSMHKKLFGNSKPLKHSESNDFQDFLNSQHKLLKKESGADVIIDEMQSLREKNEQLNEQIVLNQKKLGILYEQQEDTQLKLVKSLLKINDDDN